MVTVQVKESTGVGEHPVQPLTAKLVFGVAVMVTWVPETYLPSDVFGAGDLTTLPPANGGRGLEVSVSVWRRLSKIAVQDMAALFTVTVFVGLAPVRTFPAGHPDPVKSLNAQPAFAVAVI